MHVEVCCKIYSLAVSHKTSWSSSYTLKIRKTSTNVGGSFAWVSYKGSDPPKTTNKRMCQSYSKEWALVLKQTLIYSLFHELDRVNLSFVLEAYKKGFKLWRQQRLQWSKMSIMKKESENWNYLHWKGVFMQIFTEALETVQLSHINFWH